MREVTTARKYVCVHACAVCARSTVAEKTTKKQKKKSRSHLTLAAESIAEIALPRRGHCERRRLSQSHNVFEISDRVGSAKVLQNKEVMKD
jgi:hypothetical protein